MGLYDQRPSARYAVVFCTGAEAPVAGALVIDEDRVALEGRHPDGRRVRLQVPYLELTGVRIGRSGEERLHGRRTLLLERGDKPTVQVEPLGIGLLQELAGLVATLSVPTTGTDEQVEVVVPLKEGRLALARELIAEGPPFDPGALGLSRHEVFLTSGEAVFVFVGPGAREKLQRASRDPSLWRAGLAWRQCIGGRPHVAPATEVHRAPGQQPVYTWAAGRS